MCREGEGSVFLEAETFRMGGHATHDEAEARELWPPKVFSYWGKRDPIGMYETWLVESGPRLADGDEELAKNVLTATGGGMRRSARGKRAAGIAEENLRILAAIEKKVTAEVDAAAEEALESQATAPPPPASAAEGLYAPASR